MDILYISVETKTPSMSTVGSKMSKNKIKLKIENL